MSDAALSLAALDASRAEVSCAHCALPVPPGLRVAGAGEQYCCDGCRTVRAILTSAGLGRYYHHRELAAVDPLPVRPVAKSYEELDHDTFLRAHCTAAPGGAMSVELLLENLHCPACVWLLERLRRIDPGVLESTANLTSGSVHLVWDPVRTRLSAIARTLASLGYPPHARVQAERARLRAREDRALLSKIAVAGAATGNVMLLAFALYSGADQQWAEYFRWLSLLIATPAVFWAGSSFFRGALSAWRVRAPHMDLPVSIGIFTGWAWGAVNTARGSGEIYFDSITAIVFLLLVGRYLERRQTHRAEGARELMAALVPSVARLVEGDAVREVPQDTVEAGALLEVRAGDHLPADAIVEHGESSIDVSLLTGEAKPVDVGPGSVVHAGCINVTGLLRVRATETGRATRLGQLVSRLEEASKKRAHIQRIADRVAGRFVVAVLGLAALTVLGYSFFAPSRGLENAIALLVVTCPCALGLATPLAVSSALAQAARAGLLLKSGETLERLATRGLVVFDKTGTLTTGKLEVAELVGDPEALRLAASVERHSAHAVARALLAEQASRGGPLAELDEFRHVPGRGVEGRVDGHRVRVGSQAWLERSGAPFPAELAAALERAVSRGDSAVAVEVDAAVTAVVTLTDQLRLGASEVLRELRARGHQLALLSGDHPETVRQLAARLDVEFDDVVGGATPEAKLAYIEEHAKRGAVVMVGDGVNDAAALVAAGVGVAMHGGAEASLGAADAYVARPELHALGELFAGARRTLTVIRRNMALSLVYNLVCATLAVAGAISPLLAAILMPLSSLTVVTSSYRSRTFGARP